MREQRLPLLPMEFQGLALLSFDLALSRDPLTGLIADRATRLTCRLAGAPALAATGNLFLRGFRYRLDHAFISKIFFLLYNSYKEKASVFSFFGKSFRSLSSKISAKYFFPQN